MSHDWFDVTNVPSTGAALDSKIIRDEFALSVVQYLVKLEP